MKLTACTLALLALALGTAAVQPERPTQEESGAQEMPMPAPTPPDENHEWLEQLVGEWHSVYECSMGPDTEPMRMESTQTARSLGDLWIVAEGEMNMGDQSMANRMTLGYDPRKEAFVGTWIDSMFAHMWVYTGSLDAEGKVLTLETEGPDMTDPKRDAQYRETIEFKSPDHYVFTSSVQGADGEWTVLVRAESRRKK